MPPRRTPIGGRGENCPTAVSPAAGPGSDSVTAGVTLGVTMGRTIPQVQLSQSIQDEVALARAVDQAAARVEPEARPDAPDEETAAVVDQVMAELDAAEVGAARAPAPQIPRPRPRIPIVF